MLLILGFLLAVAGIVGCVLPVLPGPSLGFAGLLLMNLVKDPAPFSLGFMIFLLVLTLGALALDYWVPVYGAKRFGAGPRGIWGSVFGMVIGFFILPVWGIFVGGFLGAVAGEMTSGKRRDEALKAGVGVFLGTWPPEWSSWWCRFFSFCCISSNCFKGLRAVCRIAMTPEQLIHLEKQVETYMGTFVSPDAHTMAAYDLKKGHTRRVTENCRQLAAHTGLEEERARAAEAVGLLHDLGRFEQFRRFHTFQDGRSENHAHLGLKEAVRLKLLRDLPLKMRRDIFWAVAFHNVLVPPKVADGFRRCLILLIRDADKLDIWKVFIEHFQGRTSPAKQALELDLPPASGVSMPVARALLEGGPMSHGMIKSLNDLKLLLLSWLYDLNFSYSVARFQKQGIMDSLLDALPSGPLLDEIRQKIPRDVERLLAKGPGFLHEPPGETGAMNLAGG